eukprot:4737404-Alexandrium_andersonii.AAC.1
MLSAGRGEWRWLPPSELCHPDVQGQAGFTLPRRRLFNKRDPKAKAVAKAKRSVPYPFEITPTGS